LDNEQEKQPDAQQASSCNPAEPYAQQSPYCNSARLPAYRNPAVSYSSTSSPQASFNPSLYSAPSDTEKEPRILLRSAGNSASFVPILEQLIAVPILFVAVLIWFSANINQFQPSIQKTGTVYAIIQYFNTSEGISTLLILNTVITTSATILTIFITRSFLHRKIKEQLKRPSLSFLEYVKYLVFAFSIAGIGACWSTGIQTLCKNAGISIAIPDFTIKDDPAATTILIIYACVVGPILEEILFRGLVLQSLRPWGDKLAIIVSSVLFGLMHINVIQVFTTTLLGLLLAYVAIKSDSIISTIILHILYNSTLMPCELYGNQNHASIQIFYQIFLAVMILASLVLILTRRIPFQEISKQSAPNIVLPKHPYRVVFLQAAAFWVVVAIFIINSFDPAIVGFFERM
jgi:membrane protease YdiL (CAAX protease family)